MTHRFFVLAAVIVAGTTACAGTPTQLESRWGNSYHGAREAMIEAGRGPDYGLDPTGADAAHANYVKTIRRPDQAPTSTTILPFGGRTR